MRSIPPGARIPLLVGLFAATIRLVLACRELPVLDRLFVPDDTYYTLAIARSLAHGLGPSVDGVTLTSGFQPLIAFLLTPVFVLSQDPDASLRAALVLMALADGVAALCLALLAQRIWGSRAGLVAGMLWALSPIAVANALGGLETSLAVAMELAFVWASARAWESGRSLQAVQAGALAGLALLARVDAVFLVMLVGCGLLFTKRWRVLAISAAVAAMVVAPWWIACIRWFGSPVPSSGAAVREIVAQQHTGQTVWKCLAWVAGTLFGAPFVEGHTLRRFLFVHEAVGVVVFVIVAVLLLVMARVLRSRPWPEQAFAWFAIVLTGFYALYVPALWFMRRYLAPTEAVLALGLAGLITYLWQRRGTGKVIFAAASLVSAISVARWFVVEPQSSEEGWLNGAKGYRDTALEILAVAPDGAVIGSLQSGALSYYAPAVEHNQRVVNLDGVVDIGAAKAYREHRLLSFAQQRGVTHLADWPFNLSYVTSNGADGMLPEIAQHKIGMSRPQVGDQFHVLAIDWSAAIWRNKQ